MSSEERWIRIENALQTVAERQAFHEVQFERMGAHIERTDAQIEQNAAAIRDLVAHSQQTDENVGILAQNMIALVHKFDHLSDDVRDLKRRPPQ